MNRMAGFIQTTRSTRGKTTTTQQHERMRHEDTEEEHFYKRHCPSSNTLPSLARTQETDKHIIMAMADGEMGKEEVMSSQMPRGENGGSSTDISSNRKETTTDVADHQVSQSLAAAEDDSMIHSVKSGKSTGMFLSSSETAFSSTSTSVTPERKQVLLAQARADRLDWIRKVPLPYKCEAKGSRNNDDTTSTEADDVWQRDPRLAELKNTHVFQQSPAALQALSHLYGIARDVATTESTSNNIETVSKRIGEIVDQINEADGDDDRKLAVPTAEQIRNTALAEEDGDPVLRAFNGWVSELSDPAAAVLVQGMRSFCRKIRNETAGETLPAKLQGYLRLTFESLKDYAPWKEADIDENARRSLESFIYGHIEDYLSRLYWTEERKEEETNWQHRLGSLQFVNPKHLEIHCLAEDGADYKDSFQKPVESLLSVEKYFSPFEKLQRILAVYHSVNAALSDALNKSNQSEAKKLPSADDVLPSIILTVLIARPSRLLLDLQLIEDFAPPEYLRGEAGYAYTNLYGAVQFLKDIDLDAETPASLDIDAEEFRGSLKSCREATEAKHTHRKMTATNLDENEPQPVAFALEETIIPVADIRDARIRGDVVDIEWAKKRFAERTGDEQQPEVTNGNSDKHEKDDADDWPVGFTRSYTFLSSRPEDIKLSDLPKLLAEYKMLVHATESLIGEKISRANSEKKARMAAKKKEVYEAAKQVDPSLLPPVTTSSKHRTDHSRSSSM